jgi:hypothetical protein
MIIAENLLTQIDEDDENVDVDKLLQKLKSSDN